ncbi:MAG TPA: DUF4384 domain-containing protein [Pyrinomonadaceae bacterium]
MILLSAGMILMQLAAGAGVAKAQESATTWDKPREIQAPSTPKPRRKRRATRKIVRRGQQAVEQAPFLTVQYRLLKFKEGAPPVELPAQAVLHPGDLLRLAVTPNQDGFLYIIHQNEGEDGQIVFPDSRVNDGQNFVAKNREFALPPACAPVDSPDCWYKVTPSAKAEFFIVVFSRDQITDLPNQAAASGGVIKKEVIDQYTAQHPERNYKIGFRPPNAKLGFQGGVNALWITNINPKDNEEIIAKFPLIKGQ